MKDEDKTKEQLINELAKLRQRIAELEALETERRQTEDKIRRLIAFFEKCTGKFKKFSYGAQRFIVQINRRNVLFITVMKMLWKGNYLRMIRGIVMAMDQSLVRSLFPVIGIFSCFAEQDVHIGLIFEKDCKTRPRCIGF